jgi:hypothetical protein
MKKFIKLAVAAAYALPIAAGASNIDANTFVRNNIGNFINGIAVWFAGIIFAFSILVILYSAFLFITAAGNEEKVTKAKATIVFGLIGITVAMLAFGIKTILVSFLM